MGQTSMLIHVLPTFVGYSTTQTHTSAQGMLTIMYRTFLLSLSIPWALIMLRVVIQVVRQFDLPARKRVLFKPKRHLHLSPCCTEPQRSTPNHR